MRKSVTKAMVETERSWKDKTTVGRIKLKIEKFNFLTAIRPFQPNFELVNRWEGNPEIPLVTDSTENLTEQRTLKLHIVIIDFLKC